VNADQMDELLKRGQYVVGRYGTTEIDKKVFRSEDLKITFDGANRKHELMRGAGITGFMVISIDNDPIVKSWLPRYHTSWENTDYGPRAIHLLRKIMLLDDLAAI
jgi:hypothetical protein